MMAKLMRLSRLIMAAGCCLLATGCCAPGLVRLTDKPVVAKHSVSNGKKVALIVRDERPEAIQKANMCGVNYQTIFHIPVAPLFLAHAEHLDSIVAYHAKKRLEDSGYQVVSCYPKAKDALSQDKVSASRFKAEKKAAWENKDSQKMSKEDRKAATKIGKKNGVIVQEALEQKFVSPWGGALDVSGADAVIEIKINKFWTDYSYFGSASWMSVNFAVCSANDELRKVLYGNKLKGGGYMFGIITPFTPSSDSTISANTAYWFVLNGLENELASPGLSNTIKGSKEE